MCARCSEGNGRPPWECTRRATTTAGGSGRETPLPRQRRVHEANREALERRRGQRSPSTPKRRPLIHSLCFSLPPFTTMRPIGYLSAPELATLLSQPDAAAAVRVVDVRDSDYEGGHIRGCTHVPAHQFLANVGA